MEQEILFTTSKWEILSEIAKKPSAPLGIAKTLNTTIANVSQQLRLLEAAGLVKKRRLANVEPGMPRALYSLTKDFCFLSVIANGVAKKQLLEVTPLQVSSARCWLLGTSLGEAISIFLHKHADIFSKISSLYFLQNSSKEITLLTTSPLKDISEEVFHDKKSYLITLKMTSEDVNKNTAYILYERQDL